jgi:predicted extracellular nuclease
MRKIIVLLISLSISISISAQKRDKKVVTAVFYNVENLFDTINDPNIDDEEFLPSSAKKWNSERYNKKLENLAKVISSINTSELPEIVGFAEVENKNVLEDLVATSYLKNGNYKIVHQNSPDSRGIDVALIYQPDEFKYISHQIIPFKAEYELEYKLRDILYVKGILGKKDTVHVFVNHWKSRSGGEKETEKQRISQSLNLRNKVDEIMAGNKNAKILIMGDLNDDPRNTSVFETLKANNNQSEPKNLFNLMLPLMDAGKGTHSYRGDWTMLDNLIISQSFLNTNNGFVAKNNEGHIFDSEMITFTSNKGEKSPNRTYGGNNYYGGFSDHYPVYVTFIKK